MTPNVVYDTNVIVSAALTPEGIPASVIALAMERYVRLFYSPAILEDYTDVLKRPKFRLTPRRVDAFLRDLTTAATIVHPTRRISIALDEDDNRFLECARHARADYLVTGNKRHFPFPGFEDTKIVSPAEFALVIME
jgi:putative PIN family toxin of toxin-antitoxin system